MSFNNLTDHAGSIKRCQSGRSPTDTNPTQTTKPISLHRTGLSLDPVRPRTRASQHGRSHFANEAAPPSPWGRGFCVLAQRFSRLQLMSMIYVAFQPIAPGEDVEFDLSEE